MKEIEMHEIPPNLAVKFAEDLEIINQIDDFKNEYKEYGHVFIVSNETVQNWKEPGMMQVPSDVYLA
jgi:hypothetical protein